MTSVYDQFRHTRVLVRASDELSRTDRWCHLLASDRLLAHVAAALGTLAAGLGTSAHVLVVAH